MKLSLKGSRIFIAGGGGLLGRALTVLLLKKGAKVSWLVRRSTRAPRGVQCHRWSKSKDASWKKEKFDILVLAMGSHRRPVGEQSAEDFIKTQVEIPSCLTRWMVSLGTKQIIYLSSGSVYDVDPKITFEQLLNHQTNPYACSKLAGERSLENFKKDCFLKIVRLFRPYGQAHGNTMINRVLTRSYHGEVISMQRPRGILVQPIELEDVCAVIAALMLMPRSMMINLAGRERISLDQLMDRWCNVINRPILRRYSSESGRHDRKIMTTGCKELDRLISTPLEVGLKKYLSFLKGIKS